MPKGVYKRVNTENIGQYKRTAESLAKYRISRIGKKLSPESRLKVIRTLRIGKKEQNGNWKGDNAGYQGIHTWIIRNYGKPKKCEKCHKKSDENSLKNYIHWANMSNTYKRERTDWLQLCAKCHYHYDRNKPKKGDA
jgi:hypothetical protein